MMPECLWGEVGTKRPRTGTHGKSREALYPEVDGERLRRRKRINVKVTCYKTIYKFQSYISFKVFKCQNTYLILA